MSERKIAELERELERVSSERDEARRDAKQLRDSLPMLSDQHALTDDWKNLYQRYAERLESACKSIMATWTHPGTDAADAAHAAFDHARERRDQEKREMEEGR